MAACSTSVVRHRASCVIARAATGTYALAFLHDENSNGVLDRDLIGWPQEGFGFSNDASPGLGGPPSFDTASFRHEGGSTTLHLHARYGL
jgi:uncharacterized protein (DUF2141 family)